MVNAALKASDVLSKKGVEATVVNARFVKPLDAEMLEEIFREHDKVFTLEEGIVDGGYGSAVLGFMERENVSGVKLRRIGLPDEFIEHGARHELLRKYHLTPNELAEYIQAVI